MEIASDSICFLDLKIRIVNQWLVTAVYSRPTYLYFYLHRLSCHSKWNCLALYLNLDGRSIFTSTTLWFSFNNSETVKAVCTPGICSIKLLFIRKIPTKYGINNLAKSPDIEQCSDGVIPDFQISGQSLINKTFHNSKTSHNIDMKLGPVTKLDEKNPKTYKQLMMTMSQ